MLRSLLGAAAFAASVLSGLPAYAQGRASAVGVQTVETRTLSETVPVFAEIVTARNGAVASRVAGSVETIHVLAGTQVAEGDVLVELNQELLTIQVRQARARISEAQASVATSEALLNSRQVSFERVSALRDSASFSQGRFDDSQSEVQIARAQLAEAQARLDSSRAELAEAEYQLNRSIIRAPFSGIVLEVQTIPGAFIQAGTPVVTILDTGSFEIEAGIPARFVADLQPGQQMNGLLETGATVELELRAILPVEDASTRTRAVRFSASGLGDMRNLAVGQSLTVDVPVGEARDVLSVPKDALVQAQGGWTVFVAVDGKAQPRQVEIGAPAGDRYEVVNGLVSGDQVVVRGNERLRPGQDINPTPIETN
ncbi:RND family efflux transporter MFP subunit [Litoreibacter ponti]|uniref:RND family efflux transporter MFP subunit n=1 Tax=Litoreibacter ponti TaxID=1510457 RepID=A0A2T6BEN5_9RHOB|nr:efflux RND transporter periplasmic adaptor subunit [Litoreibacter ponti]PTX54516.1 RND family efflux transporter MFP subunit [Litoreibacter ponti]